MGETAFIYDNKFYYTPIGCCTCSGNANFDGANCKVIDIPQGVLPFIWNNSFYYASVGDSNYPFDHVAGYKLAQIIENVLNCSYNLDDVTNKLKEIKPTNITDRHIDLFMDIYLNL